MRRILLLALVGCGPKAPITPAAPPAEPPTTWATRVAEAKTTPEPLTSVMRDVYDVRLLVQAARAGDTLDLLMAPAREDGTQDLCAETTTLRGLVLGPDGAFKVEGASLALSADDFPSRLVTATVTGSYASQTLTLSRVEGAIDTVTFLPRMGRGLSPDAICNLLPALGPCVPCDGAAGPTCWAVAVDTLPLQASSAAVVARDRAAICADPACSAVCAPVP